MGPSHSTIKPINNQFTLKLPCRCAVCRCCPSRRVGGGDGRGGGAMGGGRGKAARRRCHLTFQSHWWHHCLPLLQQATPAARGNKPLLSTAALGQRGRSKAAWQKNLLPWGSFAATALGTSQLGLSLKPAPSKGRFYSIDINLCSTL